MLSLANKILTTNVLCLGQSSTKSFKTQIIVCKLHRRVSESEDMKLNIHIRKQYLEQKWMW